MDGVTESRDLLAVEKIFGADEPHDGIDKKRLEVPRNAIAAKPELVVR